MTNSAQEPDVRQAHMSLNVALRRKVAAQSSRLQALEGYVQHKPWCAVEQKHWSAAGMGWVRFKDEPCTCGLSALLTTQEP